ncbi:MAG: hypothetical protein PHS14_16985 [Elusimicrobia bacterium]|nr:hypothetical protein [Elusimicrobiota bacterium]
MPDTKIVFGGLMTHAKTLFLMALALAAAPSRAFAGSEALALGADKAFMNAAFSQPLPRPASGKWTVQMPVAQMMPSMRWFSLAVLGQLGGETVQGTAAPVGDIDLATLLNKQLKSPLKYSLGGKDVWISGAFDRQQNAYVSILVNGSEPLFFNVKGLLDKEEQIVSGTAKYTLRLSPNVINQMKSEIILENTVNEDDMVRITLKKMLEGVGATGAAVAVSGQNYKVFYTDDIKAGRVDKTAKSFTFILTEASGEIHVFLIPAELVPSDKISVFKMFANARVGLLQKDGKLKVYENP